MRDSERLNAARDIMLAFATETGLTSTQPPRRYLWTDAHAVCNFIALAKKFTEPAYLETAVAVVDQVHRVLGQHRDDDPREGWISGLDLAGGQKHPTAGGLRIGKPLPERGIDEPYNPAAEWDRDGQYFHYLTKWMHALYQLGKVSRNPCYGQWARELATTAVSRFSTNAPSARLVWKMSIDLSRAQMPSSGLHDPLDGYVTTLVLDHEQPDNSLAQATKTLARLCTDVDWTTDDALGIGGLLFDACRLAQLPGDASAGEHLQIMHNVSSTALSSLGQFITHSPLELPARQRLAFRELGLAIGLHGIDLLTTELSLHEETSTYFSSVATDLDVFWLTAANQNQPSWLEHLDINRVTLATSLLAPAILEI